MIEMIFIDTFFSLITACNNRTVATLERNTTIKIILIPLIIELNFNNICPQRYRSHTARSKSSKSGTLLLGETTPPPIANFQFATRAKGTGNESPRSGKDWLALGGCGYFEASESGHRPNSGTLSYLPRWMEDARCTCCTSRYDPRAQRCRVHDDGMTDRGRVRVADTGRVIGRPPGADHPRGATRVDLLARHNELTDRALLHRRQPRSRQCFCEGPRLELCIGRISFHAPLLLLLLRDSCRKIADSVESYSRGGRRRFAPRRS